MPSAQERLPGWPAGVAEALEKEARLGRDLTLMLGEGKVHLSETDGKLVQILGAQSSKAFRELRYQDYMRDVLALEALVNRYRQSNP
jgi:hypothetical protein